MAKLQQIEAEVAELPESDLRRFRSWFAAFDASRWDKELEDDSAEGKLDALAAEALAEYEAGKCRRL